MRSIGLRLPKDIDEHLKDVEQKNLSKVIVEALRAYWFSKPLKFEKELSVEKLEEVNQVMMSEVADPIPFAEEFSIPIGSIPAKVSVGN